MSQSASAVVSRLRYGVVSAIKPAIEYTGRAHRRRALCDFDERAVTIADARPLGDELSLDESGFVLVRERSAVRDFLDEHQVRSVYYPELEQLVVRLSGARRALAYDHVLRSGDEREREAHALRAPVEYAHNDYTERSGPQRLRELLPDEADALLGRRFAIVHVWRPLRAVMANPLAVADARSVSAGDLIAAERRMPGRAVENYQLRYNAAQRWYWFPAMQPGEAIVFKTFDSATDGRARFTPSTRPPTAARASRRTARSAIPARPPARRSG
jgi:hypothetical protein